MAKVYYTKEITPESLMRVYKALGVELPGKVGVKVSTGEKGAKGYLKADLIGPFVKSLGGTIVECNTAYPGERNKVSDHMKVAEEHGFTSFAEVDIMDAEGEIKIPVNKGKHLKYDLIGSHFDNYGSFVNLAHGKGHAMGGFGANLKNQSIGFASRNGKSYIHSCGKIIYYHKRGSRRESRRSRRSYDGSRKSCRRLAAFPSVSGCGSRGEKRNGRSDARYVGTA